MPYLEEHVSKDQVVTWVIQRPERLNAIGTSIARELANMVGQFPTSHPTARVLVVRAQSVTTKSQNQLWIAGGDLKELAALSSQDAKHYNRQMTFVTDSLAQLPLPVIMVVDGAAIGGGAELAIAGDIRLATKRSSLHFKQLEVGLPTGYGGAQRLTDLVGLAQTQRILYGRKTLTAEDCLTLGLFTSTTSDESLEELISKECESILNLSPQAVAAQKQMLFHATNSHPGSRLSAERQLFLSAWGNPKHQEFLDRFLNP